MAESQEPAQRLHLGEVHATAGIHEDTEAKADREVAPASVRVGMSRCGKRVQPKNRMRENRTSGTAWGVPGDRHSYHDCKNKKLEIKNE